MPAPAEPPDPVPSPAGQRAPRKVALLDRDGTIIVDKHYLSDPAGIEFAPGALEGLRLLRDEAFDLVLVTNQSGLARGYFDRAALERVHRRLQALLAIEGLALRAVYVCPHGPDDGCDCRKPAPGMLRRAMRELGFLPEEAVMIGDSEADMGAAETVGVAGIRIGRDLRPANAAADFLEAARAACALLNARAPACP